MGFSGCRRGLVEVSATGARSGSTLLRLLLIERHWQVYRTFRAQFLRAARALAEHEGDPKVGLLDVSERQFQRWIHGAQPRPDACRILESMLGHPIGRLVGPAEAGATAGAVEVAGPLAPVTDAAGGLALSDQVVGEVPVEVNVCAGAGMAVTVVWPDGAPGRVAVIAGPVRVSIDASGVDLVSFAPPVFDAPAVDGGARVYSLAQRPAR